MTTARVTTHGCPGCGAQVARHRLACPPCWAALPLPLKDDVNAAWRRRRNRIPGADREHRKAMLAAFHWYGQQRGGTP